MSTEHTHPTIRQKQGGASRFKTRNTLMYPKRLRVLLIQRDA